MHLKMSSAKWRSFCVGLNVLKAILTEVSVVFAFYGFVNSGKIKKVFQNYAFEVIGHISRGQRVQLPHMM